MDEFAKIFDVDGAPLDLGEVIDLIKRLKVVAKSRGI